MATKTECLKNIKKLNKICENLVFTFEESDEGCFIKNHCALKGQESISFGLYEYMFWFSNYKGVKKSLAYEACSAFIKGLLAGAKLLDEMAYHNFICRDIH